MAEPQQGLPYVTYFQLADMQLPGEVKVNPTIAAGDFQVKTDTGAYVPLATLPVLEPAGSDTVKVQFSAAEMGLGGPATGSKVLLRGKDQTVPKEWADVFMALNAPIQTAASLATVGVALTPETLLAIADALLNRTVAAGIDTGSDSNRTVRQYLYNVLRSRWEISEAGLLTVYHPDDVTPAFTTPLTPAPGAYPVSGGNPTGP